VKDYKITVPSGGTQMQNGSGTGAWHKVAGIKAIRTLTGLGLKEAKDMIEAAVGSSVTMKVRIPHPDYELQKLKESGVQITPVGPDTRQMIRDTLKETAVFATMSGEYGFASRINQFLLEEDNNV